MKRILASILLVVLFSVGAFGAAAAQDKEEREGGIVGTGIVGTITEVGSIYVNGQHIRFDQDQSVASPLGERLASTLVAGETVIAEAIRDGDAWHARSLRAYLPIVGPVTKIVEGQIEILGALVEVSENAASIAELAGGAITEGDWVAVSGLWRGGVVVASRIERVDPLPMASVVGTYRSEAGEGRVGSVRMLDIDIQHARPLDVLTVQGAPTPDGIEVEAVTIGLFTGPVGEVLIEGYLSEPNIEGAYTVQGSGMLAFVANPGMSVDPERGLFCGSARGVTTIERILDLPESVSLRDDLLKAFRDRSAEPCVSRP